MFLSFQFPAGTAGEGCLLWYNIHFPTYLPKVGEQLLAQRLLPDPIEPKPGNGFPIPWLLLAPSPHGPWDVSVLGGRAM